MLYGLVGNIILIMYYIIECDAVRVIPFVEPPPIAPPSIYKVVPRHVVFRRALNATVTDAPNKCKTTCVLIISLSILFVLVACLAGAIYYALCKPEANRMHDNWVGKELAKNQPKHRPSTRLDYISNYNWPGETDQPDYANEGYDVYNENEIYPTTPYATSAYTMSPTVMFTNDPVVYPGYPDADPYNDVNYPLDARNRMRSLPNLQYNSAGLNPVLKRSQTISNELFDTAGNGTSSRNRVRYEDYCVGPEQGKEPNGEVQIEEEEEDQENQVVENKGATLDDPPAVKATEIPTNETTNQPLTGNKSIQIEDIDKLSNYSDTITNLKLSENKNNIESTEIFPDEIPIEDNADIDYDIYPNITSQVLCRDTACEKVQYDTENEIVESIKTETMSVVYADQIEDRKFFRATNLMSPAKEPMLTECYLSDEV